MNIEPRIPTVKNPPEQFIGDVRLEHVSDEDYARR